MAQGQRESGESLDSANYPSLSQSRPIRPIQFIHLPKESITRHSILLIPQCHTFRGNLQNTTRYKNLVKIYNKIYKKFMNHEIRGMERTPKTNKRFEQ